MKMDYLYMKFDFDEFAEGKRFMAKSAKEKYVWDKEERKETNEYEGVQMVLEVKEDNYEYDTKDGVKTGLNLNEEFVVLIKGAKLEDYQDLVTQGFDMPKPVKVEDIEEVQYFGATKNRTSSLKVVGDVVREENANTSGLGNSSFSS